MELTRLFKLVLCVIQFIRLYHVIRHERIWLCLLQILIACVSMSV